MEKVELKKGHECLYYGVPETCCICDIAPAEYDANTGRGWGYVCGLCFKNLNLKTGIGLGQKLVLVEETK